MAIRTTAQRRVLTAFGIEMFDQHSGLHSDASLREDRLARLECSGATEARHLMRQVPKPGTNGIGRRVRASQSSRSATDSAWATSRRWQSENRPMFGCSSAVLRAEFGHLPSAGDVIAAANASYQRAFTLRPLGDRSAHRGYGKRYLTQRRSLPWSSDADAT